MEGPGLLVGSTGQARTRADERGPPGGDPERRGGVGAVRNVDAWDQRVH